ncbi:MAG: glycosyltransferase family 4 protein [Armatimonadota bacterium]|jgi:glycosyltransferase involved in cell wall biosynthesis
MAPENGKTVVQFVRATTAGVREHVIALAGGLTRDGYDVFVAGAIDPDMRRRLGEAGTRWSNIGFPSSTDSREMAAAADRLSRLATSQRAALLHAHGYHAGFIASTALRRIQPRPALVCTAHTAPRPAEGGFFARLGMRRRYRGLLGSADKLIVTSHAVAEALEQILRRAGDKCTTIYPGVDPGEYGIEVDPGVMKQVLGLNPAAVVIAIAGSLTPETRVDTFLRAAAGLSEVVANVDYLIVGRGEQRQELEELTHQLRLTGSTVFAGHREDIPAVLSVVDVLVIPALTEGAGLIALEALAMGVCVVAADVGGLREMLADAPDTHLVAPDDPDAIVRQLKVILSRLPPDEDENAPADYVSVEGGRPVRALVSERAYELTEGDDWLRRREQKDLYTLRPGLQYVAENFSLERMLEATEAAYQEVIREGATPE